MSSSLRMFVESDEFSENIRITAVESRMARETYFSFSGPSGWSLEASQQLIPVASNSLTRVSASFSSELE